MKKIILSIIVFAFVIQYSRAQEPFTHNLYTVNPFLINPASTGSEKALAAFLDVYTQWTSFSGAKAPRIYTLGVHSPVTKKMNLGLNVFSDQRNYLNHLNAMVDYSYRIDINQNSDLTFGLGLGIVNNKVSFDNILGNSMVDQTDPILTTNDYNSTKIALGAGLIYRFKAFQFHFTMPQLLEQGKNLSGQYNILGMYDYAVNSDLNLKPSMLLRAFPDNVMQFDGNIMAEYKKAVWAQFGYRTDKSLLASVGFGIGGLKLAYCYQAHMGEVKDFAPSTHEIMLSFTFPKRQPRVIVPKEDPNKDKINMSTKMIDEKYKTPVAGRFIMKQSGNVVYSEKANSNGDCSFYVEPGIYIVEITAKGYLPIKDTLNLTNVPKGSKYTYELKGVTKVEKGLVFKFAGVNFESGKDVLLPESKEILDLVAEIFPDYPKMLVEIGGHTDNVGDDASNQILSEKRVISVKNYLISKGVKAEQMQTVGYGETKPIGDNNTSEGKLKNRRVEFTVIDF